MGEGRPRSFSREAGEHRHTLPRETLNVERWLCSSPSGSIIVVVLVLVTLAFGHRTTLASTLAAAVFLSQPDFCASSPQLS